MSTFGGSMTFRMAPADPAHWRAIMSNLIWKDDGQEFGYPCFKADAGTMYYSVSPLFDQGGGFYGYVVKRHLPSGAEDQWWARAEDVVSAKSHAEEHYREKQESMLKGRTLKISP